MARVARQSYHSAVKPQNRVAHPANADGDFYVARDECMLCGAPEVQAATLMSHDQQSCYFARQPSTPEETDSALLAISVSCCGAVRYRGQDRTILVRLAEMGQAQSCDFPLPERHSRIDRCRVTFEFRENGIPVTDPSAAKRIAEQIAKQVIDSRYTKLADFSASKESASFRKAWGGTSGDPVWSSKYMLAPHKNGRWLLRTFRDDSSGHTSGAAGLYVQLKNDPHFENMKWFSDEEWSESDVNGCKIPF